MAGFYYKFIRSACVAGLTLCCIFFVLALATYADDVVNANETIEILATDEPVETIVSSSEIPVQPQIVSSGDLQLVSVSTSIQTISASDTTGFKSIILQLIGPYEMLTKEYTYTNPINNYQTKQVTTESDYVWIISCAIFIIVLYCFLRMLGGVICGRYN